MHHKIKIELDGTIVRCYYYKKIWWILGQWCPYFNKAFGSAFDAYVEYEKLCKKVNPFFNPQH